MRSTFSVWAGRVASCCGLMLGAGWAMSGVVWAGQPSVMQAGIVVSNVLQLRSLNFENGGDSNYLIHLEGNVWWVNPAQGKIVLQDDSGAVEVQMNLQGQSVRTGQRVRLEGSGAITRTGTGFRIGAIGPLMDNSGNRQYPGASSLRLEPVGRGTFPELRWIAIGQTLRMGDEDSWAQVEGEVTMASEQPDGLQMELSAMGEHMRVEVGDASGLSSALLLNHRIRATGFCQGAFTAAGQKVPGLLLVQSRKEIEFIETPYDLKASDGAIQIGRHFQC